MNIKKLRQAKGLSLKKLAELSGVNYHTVKNWEYNTDIEFTTVRDLRKISAVLDCTIDDLV